MIRHVSHEATSFAEDPGAITWAAAGYPGTRTCTQKGVSVGEARHIARKRGLTTDGGSPKLRAMLHYAPHLMVLKDAPPRAAGMLSSMPQLMNADLLQPAADS